MGLCPMDSQSSRSSREKRATAVWFHVHQRFWAISSSGRRGSGREGTTRKLWMRAWLGLREMCGVLLMVGPRWSGLHPPRGGMAWVVGVYRDRGRRSGVCYQRVVGVGRCLGVYRAERWGASAGARRHYARGLWPTTHTHSFGVCIARRGHLVRSGACWGGTRRRICRTGERRFGLSSRG